MPASIKSCPSCGKQMLWKVANCPKCGEAVPVPKHKVVAFFDVIKKAFHWLINIDYRNKRDKRIVLGLVFSFFAIYSIGLVVYQNSDEFKKKEAAANERIELRKVEIARINEQKAKEKEEREVRNRNDDATVIAAQPSREDMEYSYRESAEKAIMSVLKDPDSVKFRNQHGFCGEVNSKNSFGGYTGYTRYMAGGSIVEMEGINMQPSEFEIAWQQTCK